MNSSLIADEIRFTAEMVAAEEEEFTPDFVVSDLRINRSYSDRV